MKAPWKKRPLFDLNSHCPNCGSKIEDPTDITCAEFGLSYCSESCAHTYVNENWPDPNIELRKSINPNEIRRET